MSLADIPGADDLRAEQALARRRMSDHLAGCGSVGATMYAPDVRGTYEVSVGPFYVPPASGCVVLMMPARQEGKRADLAAREWLHRNGIMIHGGGG